MAKRKLKLSDDELVDYINACWDEADEPWTNHQKAIADECWNLYRVYREYKDKKKWQAKCVSARGFASVETAVALVKRSLIHVKDFFTVTGQERSDREKQDTVKEVVRFYLRKAKFFIKFLEALKMAFIVGLGCLKIYWKRWEEEITAMENTYELVPYQIFGITIYNRRVKTRKEVLKKIKKSELIIEAVDPYNIRRDPWKSITEKPKYVIEYQEIDFSELKALEADGYYENVDAIKEAAEEGDVTDKGASGDASDMTLKQQGDNSRAWVRPEPDKSEADMSKMAYRKTVYLKHFWGDLEGEEEIEDSDKPLRFYENWNVVVANNKFVIRKKKNPHTHGKVPYIFVPGIIIPHRFMPIGLIEPVRATMDYMDDMANMCLDSLKFDLMKMWGVDIDAVDDPVNELRVEPGGFIKLKLGGMSNVGDVLQEVISQTQSIAPALTMVKYLDQSIQMAMGVNDPLMGMMTQGESTATEYRGTLQQSTLKFESIARDIEEFAINPAIEMVYQLIFQNMDTGILMDIMGKDGQSIEEYIMPERIAGNYDFYANGITGYLSQLEYISKMVTIFSTMVQAAQILQLTPPEARKIFKQIIKAQGVKDIDDILPDVPPIPPQMPMGPGGPGQIGEAPTQPPNPELAPENVMQQMMAGMNRGIGGM